MSSNPAASAAPAGELDHIGYVRQRLTDTPANGFTRIAADAGVTVRTLYNLRDKRHEPSYSTVMNLFRILKLAEEQQK